MTNPYEPRAGDEVEVVLRGQIKEVAGRLCFFSDLPGWLNAQDLQKYLKAGRVRPVGNFQIEEEEPPRHVCSCDDHHNCWDEEPRPVAVTGVGEAWTSPIAEPAPKRDTCPCGWRGGAAHAIGLGNHYPDCPENTND